MKRAVPLARTAFKRTTPDPHKKVANKKKGAQAASKKRGSGRTSRRGHASAAEARYLDQVAALGCILCLHHGIEGTPAVVHRPRVNLFGMALRASNWDVIPLCPTHHVGRGGVHDLGHNEFTQVHGVSEVELMARVKRLTGNDNDAHFEPVD
jgi:hypothetical protein